MQDELDLNWFDYGARMYDPELGRFTTLDPSSSKYFSWTPYSYVFDNPVRLIDPNGADPIDPRTGKEYQIDLQRASVISVNRNTYNFDGHLYVRSQNLFPWPIGVGSYSAADGLGGSVRAPAVVSFSSGAKSALGITSDERRGPPHLKGFEAASKSGSYTFIDNNFKESGFYVHYSENKSVNVVSVEKNTVKQVSNLTLNEDGQYDVNYVRTFSTETSDVKEKEVKTLFGGTKTVKYRTVTTTEKTQFYKDNKERGPSYERTYRREEKIK